LVSLAVIDQGGTAVDWSEALQRSAKPEGRGVGLKVALSGMETVGGDILFSAAANGSQVTIRWPGK
jgi:hypothetical protein